MNPATIQRHIGCAPGDVPNECANCGGVHLGTTCICLKNIIGWLCFKCGKCLSPKTDSCDCYKEQK